MRFLNQVNKFRKSLFDINQLHSMLICVIFRAPIKTIIKINRAVNRRCRRTAAYLFFAVVLVLLLYLLLFFFSSCTIYEGYLLAPRPREAAARSGRSLWTGSSRAVSLFGERQEGECVLPSIGGRSGIISSHIGRSRYQLPGLPSLISICVFGSPRAIAKIRAHLSTCYEL